MTIKPTTLRLTATGLAAVLAFMVTGTIVLAGDVGSLSSEVATMRTGQQQVGGRPSTRPGQDDPVLTPDEVGAFKLLYICERVRHCRNYQELEVFDALRNPIFSVGAYGGAAMFGDNFSVFPPGTVYRGPGMTRVTHHGREGWLVQSYESPTHYTTDHAGSQAGCTAPSLWVAPQGFWHCSNGGRWVRGT